MSKYMPWPAAKKIRYIAFLFLLHFTAQSTAMETVLNPAIEFAAGNLKHTLIKQFGLLKNYHPQEHQQSLVKKENSVDDHDNRQNSLGRVHPAGVDGRSRIVSTQKYPFRNFGVVRIAWPALSGNGSGILVGPQHVLTAAHCVYNKNRGGWVQRCTFIPGQSNADKPFGEIEAARIFTFKEWLDDENPDFDIALLVLERPVGMNIGWFGLMFTEELGSIGNRITVTGYPASIERGGSTQLWTMTHKALKIEKERLYYEIDTEPGQSGSPVWAYFDYSDEQTKNVFIPLVLGIHIRGESVFGEGNNAARITEQKFKQLITWLSKTKEIIQPADGGLVARRIRALLGTNNTNTTTIAQVTRTADTNRREESERYEALYQMGCSSLDEAHLSLEKVAQAIDYFNQASAQHHIISVRLKSLLRLAEISLFKGRTPDGLTFPPTDSNIEKAIIYLNEVVENYQEHALRAEAHFLLSRVFSGKGFSDSKDRFYQPAKIRAHLEVAAAQKDNMVIHWKACWLLVLKHIYGSADAEKITFKVIPLPFTQIHDYLVQLSQQETCLQEKAYALITLGDLYRFGVKLEEGAIDHQKAEIYYQECASMNFPEVSARAATALQCMRQGFNKTWNYYEQSAHYFICAESLKESNPHYYLL